MNGRETGIARERMGETGIARERMGERDRDS